MGVRPSVRLSVVDGVRLSVVDEMFLWTHNGLGLPTVMQGVWRTDGVVDRGKLEQLCASVASGPLGRRVRRPRVPGARPEFIVDSRHYPLSFPSDPVPVEQVIEWADAQALTSVDPEHGPGWRIAATLDSHGGTVVSVTCSHVLADARGLINALSDAIGQTNAETLDPLRFTSPTHGSNTATAHGSDTADALSTGGRVLGGLARAVGGLILSSVRRAELRAFRNPPVSIRHSDRRAASSAILEIDQAQWDEVATAAGGTPNSLFLACVSGIARRGNETGAVTLSVPMSIRTTERMTNSVENAVAMVPVTLRRDTTLAQIRNLCRDAFEAPPMSSPAGFPAEILQVIPDRLAHRLADGPGQRDALCSNIGTVEINEFDGHATTGLALRAVHPDATRTQLNSTSTRVSGYLCHTGANYTLSLVSFEAPDNQGLREQARYELEKYGITARHW